MNKPRLLLFGPFLPPHTYLPSREQNVHPEVFFLSVGLHLAIMAHSCLSKPRSSFAFVNRCSHRFTLECHSLQLYMPFILPDAPHRTDYSQYEGDQRKLHFTIKNFFPKKVIKKSINQLFMSIRGMGLRRSSEPKAHV